MGTKFVRISYAFRTNFVQFLCLIVASLHVCSPILHSCLAHFSTL